MKSASIEGSTFLARVGRRQAPTPMCCAAPGERTLDVALRAAITDAWSVRPVELRAAFLLPIPATGAPIESRASVVHLGRHLAAARGELRHRQGRPAVLVDATYIAC